MACRSSRSRSRSPLFAADPLESCSASRQLRYKLRLEVGTLSAEIDFYPSYAIVKERLGLRREAPIHPRTCGADRDRTDDIQLAKLALSQLSYSPKPVGRLNLKVDRR